MGLVERGDRPGLRAQPDLVALRPRFLGAREATAVTEEEFREPVPGAEEIGPNVFATAEEIAGGFFLLGRNVNRRQGAGAIEHGEVAGIAAIGLDAITGPARNQRRCDHLAWNVARTQGAPQLEAAGPSFVAACEGPFAAETLDEFQNGGAVRRQRMQRRCRGHSTDRASPIGHVELAELNLGPIWDQNRPNTG